MTSNNNNSKEIGCFDSKQSLDWLNNFMSCLDIPMLWGHFSHVMCPVIILPSFQSSLVITRSSKYLCASPIIIYYVHLEGDVLLSTLPLTHPEFPDHQLVGISRACAHLLLCEWNMFPGLTFPRAHCYNNRQCTAAVAAMPSVVPLLLLEGNHWKT